MFLKVKQYKLSKVGNFLTVKETKKNYYFTDKVFIYLI